MIRENCHVEESASILLFVISTRIIEGLGTREVRGCILAARGVDMPSELDEHGDCIGDWIWLEELIPDTTGMWVWEGKTSFPDGPEREIAARGVLRRPTLSEVARVAAGIDPFQTGTIAPLYQPEGPRYDFTWEDEVT